MNPEITSFAGKRFIGLKTELRNSKEAGNNMTSVPMLWKKTLETFSNHPKRIGGERYALISGDLPMEPESIATYYSLIEVDTLEDIPDGFLAYEIPAGKIIKFRHQGPPQTIGQTTKRVFFEWLPTSSEKIAGNAELFIYPDGYNRNEENSFFYYCLFLAQE